VAENPLGELLGKDEGDDADGGEAFASVDPFAASLALTEAETSSEVSRDLSSYLQALGRLARVQYEHLHEQRLLNIGHLRVRLWRERLQLGLQACLGLIAAAVVVMVAVVFHDAINSRQVIVDAFETPPALAARGLTGKVLAEDMLDALSRLQSATRANARKRDLASAWEQDVKIEVPETGVSVGEIDRLLRARFGHDQHVTGDLVQEPDGRVTLRIRGEGAPARAFTGEARDVDALVTRAAEYIYGADEPFLFAVYLNQSGRPADADAFLSSVYPVSPPSERAALANVWGNAVAAQGRYADAATRYRMAITADPHLWSAWSNLIGVVVNTEDEEAAWAVGNRLRALTAGLPSDQRPTPANWVDFDPLTGDFKAEMADLEFDAGKTGGQGTSDVADGPSLADTAAHLHDWQAADRYLLASDASDPHTKAERLFIQGYRALDEGRPADAIGPLTAFEALKRSDPMLAHDYYGDYACYLGLAYALTGQAETAESVFARAGRWVSCQAFRADALDHAGDWTGAQAAYAAAVRSAPDLPFAYDRWGLALLRHGLAAQAADRFAQAHRLGPHWADPLAHWGDALAAQGLAEAAAARRAQAAAYAPQWRPCARDASAAP
jgi:tetratricopeptide (TPR) repeat protein